MTMNMIKLTSNDIKAMVNEAVKRTLSAKASINEGGGYPFKSNTPLYDLRQGRKTSRYYPYPTDDVWKTRQTPQWFKDNGEKISFDDAKMNESILEDIEDFKFGMEKVIAKVEKLKVWAAKKNVGLRGFESAFKNHAGIGGKMDNTIYSGNKEVKLYIDAKKAATKRYEWDIIDEYADMSPEERDADIKEYLVPALEKQYRGEYDEYSGDFDKAIARRGEVEGNIAEFMKEFGGANPEQMSYVELLKAKEAIFNFADKNNAFDTESRPFFQERGLDLDDLRKKVGQELRKRYDSVPHFYFCANETDTPEGKARYDKQMEEYKQLKAKTNAHSLKEMERNASYGESMRGFNWSTKELVDDNGELVCTVRFEVDSSD